MQWLVRAGAGVVLVCILIFFTYMWPIPYLGFAVNPLTGYVQAVDPAGSADQAGMRVHDRIIRLYGSSWHQFAMASNKLALATPHIPIMVERNGQRVTLDLVQHAPTVTFQAIKLLTLTLAVVCWLTGYICLVRTHQFAGRVIVAVFWLMSSYIIGSYLFAVYNSAYFWFAIQCCVLLLLPLVPYVHILVPIRVVPKKHLVWTQWSVIILEPV